jgi:hypothetical protein
MELQGTFCIIMPTVRPPAVVAGLIKRIWETVTHPTDLIVLNGSRGKSATLNEERRRCAWEHRYYVTIDDDIWLPDCWQDDCIEAIEIGGYGAVGLDLAGTPEGAAYVMEVNPPETYEASGVSVRVRPLHRQNIAGIFICMTAEVARAVPEYPWCDKTHYEFDEDGFRCGRIRAAGYKLGYVQCKMGAPVMVKHDDAPEYLAMKEADIDLIRHRGVAK